MHRLRGALVRVLLLAVIATAVVTLFLAATISRPITKLSRMARRVAKGDQTVSLNSSRRDEIGDLARAIDVMAGHLKARAAETAEWAANISHEFKSPLTSLRGSAELLLDGADEDPTARRKFIRNMLADTHRLDRLVTRLLELSRLEADPTAPEPCDFRDIIRTAIAEACSDDTVELTMPDVPLPVRVRRAAMTSALRNLIENAHTFADQGSPVRITVCLRNDTIETIVHNRGPVISAANQKRIWTRFFTTRANAGGTGLGLPIVKSVATAHGGSVWVESDAESGTRFSLCVPMA
jgi:two-component system sensor histidine kinase ChvG